MGQKRIVQLAACMLLAGCADYPGSGPAPAGAGAAYPILLPLSDLGLPSADTPDAQADAAALAARLRALTLRAAALRGGVLAAEDRQRLQSGRTR